MNTIKKLGAFVLATAFSVPALAQSDGLAQFDSDNSPEMKVANYSAQPALMGILSDCKKAHREDSDSSNKIERCVRQEFVDAALSETSIFNIPRLDTRYFDDSEFRLYPETAPPDPQHPKEYERIFSTCKQEAGGIAHQHASMKPLRECYDKERQSGGNVLPLIALAFIGCFGWKRWQSSRSPS